MSRFFILNAFIYTFFCMLPFTFFAQQKEFEIDLNQEIQKKPQNIPWFRFINLAMTFSAVNRKPLLLFFLDVKRCEICKRIVDEVFNNLDFEAKVKDSYTFIYFELREDGSLPVIFERQNEDMKKWYQVDTIPTLIIDNKINHTIERLTYNQEDQDEFLESVKEFVLSGLNAKV